MFNQMPDLTMSVISSSPDPKTMAFGPVAMGSINAQEEAIVAGIISKKGCISMASASEARTGSMMDAVATLEVTSVKKLIDREIVNMMRNRGSTCTDVSCFPSHSASSEL